MKILERMMVKVPKDLRPFSDANCWLPFLVGRVLLGHVVYATCTCS